MVLLTTVEFESDLTVVVCESERVEPVRSEHVFKTPLICLVAPLLVPSKLDVFEVVALAAGFTLELPLTGDASARALVLV